MKQSSNENARTLFLLYELWQVEALERRWRERPEERVDSLVIALALDIEAKLTEQNITFSSGRRYKQTDSDLLTTEDEMMTAFFADPQWSSFIYRGVELRATFLFMFRAYLQRVWYYGNLLIALVETHPRVEHLVLFAPGGGVVSAVAGGLAGREIRVVVDCAQTIAAAHGIAVEVISRHLSRASLRNATSLFIFTARRMIFGFSLMVWNVAITLLRRPCRPRLIISDYWKNVSPSVELLKQGECIFLDRMEIRNINRRTLLRYRMRFVHAGDFLSRGMRARARENAQKLAREWNKMRAAAALVFICRGYSLDPLLLNAVDDIVRGFEKTMCEIEGTYALYECLQPDAIILRASVSGQTHFSVLPLVAKQCGIPSVELQHGLEYLGTGSLSREHLAEYLAVYGPLVKKELRTLGYAPEKVREIGSPRFDVYHEVKSAGTQERFTVLCIAPDIRPFEIYDSYSAEEYFSAVAAAAETIPNTHVIIKLRAGPAGESSLRAAIANSFSRVPHTIAQSEPLSDLFTQADAVVSCYSTAILEALQCGMPVIIPALNPIDAEVVRFHFLPYRDAGALDIAFTHGELGDFLTKLSADSAVRRDRQAKIRAFLVDNFCFDGDSSSRFAALITELARLGR